MIDMGSRSSSPEYNYDVDISPRSNDLYKHHHVFQPARRHSANIMLDLIHLKEDGDPDADYSDIVSVADPSSAAPQPPLSPITIDISEPSSSTSPTFSSIHSPSPILFNSRPGSQDPDPPTRRNSRFHELDEEVFNWIYVPDPRLHHLDRGLNRSAESFARKVQAEPHLYITPRRGESIAALIRRLVAKWLALIKLGKLKRR